MGVHRSRISYNPPKLNWKKSLGVLKGISVALLIVCFFWAMLTNEMYETEKEQRLYCVASGGTWIKPDIHPWNLVEGECK
jgi:hypothetical protein